MHRDGGTCPDQLWERNDYPYQYFDLLFDIMEIYFTYGFFFLLLPNFAATAVKTRRFGGWERAVGSPSVPIPCAMGTSASPRDVPGSVPTKAETKLTPLHFGHLKS